MHAFQYMAAALYLAAGVAAVLGLALPAPRVLRGSRVGLALGAFVQTAAFATLHRLEPAPSLTDFGLAVAVMAWLGVLFTLLLFARLRLPGFVPPIAFIAFLTSFGVTLSSSAPSEGPALAGASGTIPHAHVLLASAGLAALGVAALAGFFFLMEHRALKLRRSVARRAPLPSLEALDRVNRVALALGFPLLSLGVVTGALWLDSRTGELFGGRLHEIWMLIAWTIYLGLVALRFGGGQGARQAAASAVAGFAFLLFAVLGAGLVS
ncbi:MAG: cytochrome c biogenesis protein CcsA [bacterium]|nr:cytochrome c biogenesis protein CcsA [bacterium]